MQQAGYNKTIAIWLLICCVFVFMTVTVGAITRLSEAGLSITEWKPVSGVLPPLTEAAWQEQFALYKASPEFQKKHFWMEIGDFKSIFFWEWFHRVLARSVGMVFALPLAFFWIRGMIPQGWKWKFAGLLILGGMQGALGWYMVKSGLIDRPSVSHYRLAAHLGLAFVLFSLLLWSALRFLPAARSPDKALRRHVIAFLGVLVPTIFWGAYTAGLDAGLIYNDTFPKMGGHWMPPDIWQYAPGWINFLENPVGVQFVHRWLAMLTVLGALSLWGHAVYRKQAGWPVHGLMAAVVLQFLLGLATLMSHVAMPLAAAHQGNALLLLGFTVACLYRYGGYPSKV